ncbi:hypothetical protein JKA74_20230 [Marivirga sp. S37H4]|uniref:VLRF1 domain-containing protein n=1 Tax=Marivirga aurantiaca TaxID=2802615 RepID=A0A934X2R9_9BACT|nr:hypothetical protein [Marivirga aurantiaca]MBK6267382.1 hypothetical protein [Marivirga aurantiaca]
MINPVVQSFDIEQTKEIVQGFQKAFPSTYDFSKHRFIFQINNELEFYFRLPLPFQLDYLNQDTNPEDWSNPYIITIIQSGSAALAYCEGLQIIEHKVFKAYMVRKKQGKSQIKYLKTKGKSKAGSRVRLSNTAHFFEEIVEKMGDWLNYYEVERIALSLNKTLYPYFFNKDNDILDKKDERIFKIPKHIEEPSFENLIKIHSYLLKAELIYSEEHKELINKAIKI